jgi:hypothetical protein
VVEASDAQIMDAIPEKEQKALMGALERIAGLSIADFVSAKAA